MAKQYNYGNASSQSTGIMVCNVCGKPITEGDYRYRETEMQYINHHRTCSAEDPNWALRDRKDAAQAAKSTTRVQECLDFYRKWGIRDLLDVVEQADLDAIDEGLNR